MNALSFQAGKWRMQAAPHDGARIVRLAYDGYDLLTAAPRRFRPPRRDYGRYETRPVYGYDDCFPSVDPGRFPGMRWRIPDHGELCWLPWAAAPVPGGLRFSVQSRKLPLTFSRTMIFDGNKLRWRFAVRSQAGHPLVFQHVMHPLMPLDRIDVAGLKLPDCDAVFDEARKCEWVPAGGSGRIRHAPFCSEGFQPSLNIQDAHAQRRQCAPCRRDNEARAGCPHDNRTDKIIRRLESKRSGGVDMLILRGVKTGRFQVAFQQGPVLHVGFPAKKFTALGIWWNNRGYPDEPGCRRCECAFEPIPGETSSLAAAARMRSALTVLPGKSLRWAIDWEIK